MFRFPRVARPGARRPARRKLFGTSSLSAVLPLLTCLLLPASLAAQQRTLSGSVKLGGPDSVTPINYAVPLTFDFGALDKSLLFSRTVTPAANGTFTITDLPSGRYILSVKGSKWLRVVASPATSPPAPADPHTLDLTGGNLSNVVVPTLPGGDADNNNTVDIGDFGILVNAYGGDITIAGSGYDYRADFNNDGVIDIGDFGILVNSYNANGDVFAANLQATGIANGVRLTWTIPAGSFATNYRINRNGTDLPLVSANADPTKPTTVTYDDAPGLSFGTLYSYYVVPVYNDPNGVPVVSPPSNTVVGTPMPPSLDVVDKAQPGWAEDIIPTDSPATPGAGPSSATSIDVTSGILENHPGPDLDAHNGVGLSPSFARLYRSAQAERGYHSPGMAVGWSHNYDLRITQAGSILTLAYPNGATEKWTVSGSTITPQTQGTPYVVTGIPNGTGWTSLTMQFKDRTSYVFELRDSNTYRLTKMLNAVGSIVYIAYDAGGKLTGIQNDKIDSMTGQHSPDQALMTFTYMGSLMQSVTDNIGGRTVTYGYDTSNNLNKVYQVNSTTLVLWTYTYDTVPAHGTVAAWPLLTQVGVPDPAGSATPSTYPKTEYDSIGRATAFHDANNNARTYGYGVGQTTVAAREADGTLDTQWTQLFDAASGADKGTVDAYGFASIIVYGDTTNPKQPTSLKNRNGQETTIVYDGFGNVVSVKTPFKHNDVTQQLITKFAYTYTDPTFPFGRLDSIQEGNFTLNEFRTPTTYTYYNGTDIKNGVVQPKGLLHTVTGPIPGTSSNASAALVQEYIYTALGNVSQLNYPAPNNNPPAAGQTYNFVSYTFDYTTDPINGTVNARTEKLGQPTYVTPPGIITKTGLVRQAYKKYDYDANGNVIYESDRLGYITKREYNGANQVTKISYPADTGINATGNYLTLDYNYFGGGLSFTKLFSATGMQIQSSRSSAGSEGEFKTLTGDALSSGRDYDALYRAKAVRDGNGHQSGQQYDLVGNAKRLTFPGNTGGTSDSRNATYDADGNTATQTNGDNLTTVILREPEDSQVSTVQYSTRSNVTLQYDDYGRVNDVSDGVAEQQFDYDDLDNVTEVRTIYKDIPNKPTRTVHYDYFPDGSRKDMITPSGTYSYTYYDSGQLFTTTTPWLTITDYYQNNGRLGEETTTPVGILAALTDTTYSTNPRGLLTSLGNRDGAANALSLFGNFTYDVQGNRRGMQVDVPRINTAPPISGGKLTYGYDTFSRLTSENGLFDAGGTAASTITQDYLPGYNLLRGYDSAGNMTQVPGQGSINYDLNDQIVGKSKNGNGDATDYGTFDETSRLKKANTTPVGPGFTAGYLADGRRAWKQSNASGATRFYYLYDGDRVIAELNANGTPTNAFGYGFAGLATRQESASPTRYHVYLYDPQGNAVERLTSTNGTNSYQVDYVGFYDAYGTQRSQISAQGAGTGVPNQFPTPDMVGFKGQFGAWTDNETSYIDPGNSSVPLQIRTPGVWTGGRYYDPAVARALSRQTYLATQNLLGDAALANLYAADPNPLGHTLGNVLAGAAGGYFGGPYGSAVAVGAWETLYSTALGEPLDTALAQGVVAGITDFAAGKVFHAATGIIGAGIKSGAQRIGELKPLIGTFSKVVKGRIGESGAKEIEDKLFNETGTRIVYGSAEMRGRFAFNPFSRSLNEFNPATNTIHFFDDIDRVRRGVFYEEVQHAFDYHSGAYNHLLPGAYTSPLLNARLHAITARNIANNQLLPTTAGQTLRLLRLATRLSR